MYTRKLVRPRGVFQFGGTEPGAGGPRTAHPPASTAIGASRGDAAPGHAP